MNFFPRLVTRAILIALAGIALQAAPHTGVATFRGLPVPGAIVTVTQGEHKLTTSTDENGAYSFADLPDGNWTIEISMTGFAPVKRDIAVSLSAPAATWELKLLPPGTTSQSRKPGGPAITAQNRTTPAAAARNQQAAQSNSAPAPSGGGGGGGGDALVMSGSLGGSSGSMMQADSFGNSVRNGRVVYNGNLGFTLDNSVWDAQSYSLNGIPTPKPAFARGHFNASFGGPLKIPKLLSGKGGMFTINYQAGRTRNGSDLDVTVPSALERAGNFSESIVRGPVTVYDPQSSAPFPGNIIPTSRLDPTALKLIGYYPMPNALGSRLNYQTPIVSVSNQDNVNSRLNQQLNKKDRLSGSIGYQRRSTTTPNVFGFIDGGANNGINTSISWSHTFNKRLINNLTFTFSRSHTELSPYFANRTNVAANLGIQGTSPLPLDWGPPSLGFTNFATLADGNASLSRNQTGAINDGVIVTRGKHQFNFGGDYQRRQINPLSDVNGRGTYTFTGIATSLNGAGGYDFADFLLGQPDTASIRFGNPDKYFRTWKIDGYATDNWQFNKALTFNLGVRYDFTAPFTELYNRMANLEIAPGFSGITPYQAGQSSQSLPSSIIKPTRNAFGPNLGIAWRPFPKHTKRPTIIRLGYGISHPLDSYTLLANNMAAQPPFAKVLTVANTLSTPLNIQQGFTSTPVIANTYAVDPNYRMPVIHQWNAFVQQMLPHGVYVFLGYYGVVAYHLDQEFLPNSLPPGVAVPANWPASGYIYEQSNGRISGNSMFLSAGRQMGSGFSAFVNAGLSGFFGNGGIQGQTPLAQNWLDLSAERARLPFGSPFYMNANWQYSTGQGKAGGTLIKGWKGGLIKDWTLINSLTLRTGVPLTPTVGGLQATVGGTGITGTVRPDATGLPIAAPSGSGEPFNLAAFAVPAPGNWGNAGRGTIPGPAQFSLNASVSRVFRLSERRSFDLRFDANNVINHVTVSSWSTVVNAYNFGLPTGAAAMRTIVANLRFRF